MMSESKLPNDAPTIRVRNLHKSYGAVKAVRGISFDVSAGEIVGFLGPNGAGKSTVLKILTCYMSGSSGSVRVAGHDVYKSPLKVRRAVGYQPENVPLYDEMMVFDYLLFMAKMQSVPRRQRRARVRAVGLRCGLASVMDKIIRELSKGFRQRVGLAQALIHDPPVLILDEPMSGLDPNQILEIRDLIKEVGAEKTVIFSSHILQEIERLCDRLLILDRGKLVANGSLTELSGSIEGLHRYQLTAILGADESELEGVLSGLDVAVQRLSSEPLQPTFVVLSKDPDLRVAIAQAVATTDWQLIALKRLAPQLEEIFRALTDGSADRPDQKPLDGPADAPVDA